MGPLHQSLPDAAFVTMKHNDFFRALTSKAAGRVTSMGCTVLYMDSYSNFPK